MSDNKYHPAVEQALAQMVSWPALKVYEDVKALTATARAVVGGYDYTPGDSDLDAEQLIVVRMTLGDYRKACRALAAFYGKENK